MTISGQLVGESCWSCAASEAARPVREPAGSVPRVLGQACRGARSAGPPRREGTQAMTRSLSRRSVQPPMRVPAGHRARPWRWVVPVGVVALTMLAMPGVPAAASRDRGHSADFRQINLVSDVPGAARLTDPDLVNAWGMAASPGTNQQPGSPLWVSDNGTDKTTLYAGATATSVTKAGLVVNIASGAPTGQVFNIDQSGFMIHDGNGHSGPAIFIFDSENGGIDAWNPAVGATGASPSTVTETPVTNGANAVYKGLATGVASNGHTYLYAANFRSGRVEAYDSTFTPVELPGGLFVDPRIPAGYAPFNVQELLGKLYVSYAKQDATLHDDVAGSGHGFVDVFTNDGALVKRLVTRGALNSPWGLATAPAGFGRFGGALLVGNFGDGRINAYNPHSGAHLGQLRKENGRPIVVDGLWGLRFGNGNAAKSGELLFSAGPNGESHGLLGKIAPIR
ncbi:MAG: TIGR03118 family protein [Pseudonocardiales bacterium]